MLSARRPNPENRKQARETHVPMEELWFLESIVDSLSFKMVLAVVSLVLLGVVVPVFFLFVPLVIRWMGFWWCFVLWDKHFLSGLIEIQNAVAYFVCHF